MRNKFVYSCSIKIHSSGFDRLLGSIFCLLLVVEVFFLQKVVEMLEEVVVDWWEVRWIGQMGQNFVARFVQLLKYWLCSVWSGVVVEKNWAFSVDQSGLQALQFSVHLIDLLSIVLRCKDFSRNQKVVVDQTNSRPPVTVTFFGASLTLGSALELLLGPSTELVVASCVKSTFHHVFFHHSSTSPVVTRGSVLTILSVGHCHLPVASHYAPHLQGSHFLYKTSRATTVLNLH